MASRHLTEYRTLASLSRINLLHELQQHGWQTVAELAKATGLHHNTAREHLHHLIDTGFVDSEPIPRQSKGRPRIRYRAARGADSAPRKAWLEASEQRSELIHKLMPLTTVTADRTPMARQLDILDDHMDQCGFEADIQPDGTRMTMHNCPFADLARNHPQVCEVHFALVRDVLEISEGPLRATGIHPFSGPAVCVVDMDGPGASHE